MSAKKLALSAIGASISLIAVTLAYFIDAITLTFYAVSAFGILIPLTKEYYKESFFAVIAVTGIGVIYTNIYILPFSLIFGSYTIVAVLIHKKKIKPLIYVPSLVAYSSLCFFIFYKVTALLFIDITKISILSELTPTLLYIILNLAFTISAFIYHIGIIEGYKYLIPIVNKIGGK